MPAWLPIAALLAAAMVAVVLALTPSREDFAWFLRLRRPRWLIFEPLIPLIWIVIYGCFYASALVLWQSTRQGWLVAAYLPLLLLVQSYTWLICRTRRLRSGTAVGFAGWVWGVALALVVWSHSGPAALLLLPYLLWSPVGTFVTWRMEALNR
jgi:benzodiazapine receptor